MIRSDKDAGEGDGEVGGKARKTKGEGCFSEAAESEYGGKLDVLPLRTPKS